MLISLLMVIICHSGFSYESETIGDLVSVMNLKQLLIFVVSQLLLDFCS